MVSVANSLMSRTMEVLISSSRGRSDHCLVIAGTSRLPIMRVTAQPAGRENLEAIRADRVDKVVLLGDACFGCCEELACGKVSSPEVTDVPTSLFGEVL